MALTKGIVSGGNYTFSAANQTITFSNDYIGMSLSDVTYITNIKSGVATVIYDPFDATKGGVLNGLVLTLAYNTTSMGDTDPLQIIVGFTPLNSDPTPVRIVEGPDQKDDADLLNRIADGVDYLNLALDRSEGIQMHVTDPTILKDANQIPISIQSDRPYEIGTTFTKANDALVVDTTGYGTVIFTLTSTAVSMINSVEISENRSTWVSTTYIGNSSNSSGGTWYGAGSTFSISGGITYYYIVPCTFRYVRLRCSSYFSGTCNVTAALRSQASAFNFALQTSTTGLPVVISSGNTAINGWTAAIIPALNPAGTGISDTGVPTAGTRQPGSAVVTAPVMVGGREAPTVGSLSGTTRILQTDPQGRYILGGDYDGTRPRDPVTGIATGPNNTAPTRGVGGIPNNMRGAQSLTVADTNQDFGDTQVMLMRQILTELKILNQQFAEMPFLLNQANFPISDPQEYRNDGDFDSSLQ